MTGSISTITRCSTSPRRSSLGARRARDHRRQPRYLERGELTWSGWAAASPGSTPARQIRCSRRRVRPDDRAAPGPEDRLPRGNRLRPRPHRRRSVQAPHRALRQEHVRGYLQSVLVERSQDPSGATLILRRSSLRWFHQRRGRRDLSERLGSLFPRTERTAPQFWIIAPVGALKSSIEVAERLAACNLMPQT